MKPEMIWMRAHRSGDIDDLIFADEDYSISTR